eukprot:9989408-Heterocapsa_arctica.AAC.1
MSHDDGERGIEMPQVRRGSSPEAVRRPTAFAKTECSEGHIEPYTKRIVRNGKDAIVFRRRGTQSPKQGKPLNNSRIGQHSFLFHPTFGQS